MLENSVARYTASEFDAAWGVGEPVRCEAWIFHVTTSKTGMRFPLNGPIRLRGHYCRSTQFEAVMRCTGVDETARDLAHLFVVSVRYMGAGEWEFAASDCPACSSDSRMQRIVCAECGREWDDAGRGWKPGNVHHGDTETRSNL